MLAEEDFGMEDVGTEEAAAEETEYGGKG